MAIFDDPPKKQPAHEIGQDLSLLSRDELQRRVGLLQEEIGRLEQAMTERGATKSAAEALFKR
ncbi:MAG: DUF1192 domain-containing protein [Rhizobiaceae bacterium]